MKFTPQYNPGPINCIDRNLAPHEYFLHLLGEKFLLDIIDDTHRYGDAKTNSLCFGINKNRVKKLYIKDSRLYLGEGIKGGAFGAIAASLIPSLTG